MSRQTELMALSENSTQKLFTFTLQNASKGLLTLRYTPDGWSDSKFQLRRNEIYHGLFRYITFNQLTFVKDGRDFIRDVYEMEGINAKIIFTVYRLNTSTQAYVSYFAGKLDLSTYKIDETGCTCQVVDTQLAEKVKNRESVKVNIREHISIEGYDIPLFTAEDPTLYLPDYNITARATWGDRANMDSTMDNHYVPLWEGLGADFTEVQSQDPDHVIEDDYGMFIDSASDRDLSMTVRVKGEIIFNSYQPHATFTIKLYNNGVVEETIGTVTGSGVNSLSFDFSHSFAFTVLTGHDFWLQGTTDHSGTTTYTSVYADIAEVQSLVPGTAITAYPYYEALQRLLQIITDSNDCFKSTKFGRTDSEITTYGSDGQLGHITKGLYIRNASGLNNALSISLRDFFKSLTGVFCLGMGVETISGVDKVVIEDLSYFYSSTVIVDLSARIREAAIGKEVLPEKHYSSIKVGYNSFEYLTAGGLAEFNTKSEFTTVLAAVDNSLDLVSQYRADTQGIVLSMAASSDDTDVKGDEDTFIIDSVRRTAPYTGFQARTNEDFILVTGGADADNSFNLDLTPKRNLIRNGQLIRAGLEKNLGTYVRWQAGDKNTTLQTQKTLEGDPIAENADIWVNDLQAPFYLPEVYTVECEMDYDDLEAILDNPKGLIKLSDTKYGWILELTIGNKENKAEMRLLRANLDFITVSISTTFDSEVVKFDSTDYTMDKD